MKQFKRGFQLAETLKNSVSGREEGGAAQDSRNLGEGKRGKVQEEWSGGFGDVLQLRGRSEN